MAHRDMRLGNKLGKRVILVVEKLEHQLEKTKGRLVARTHPRRRPVNSVSVLRERVRTA